MGFEVPIEGSDYKYQKTLPTQEKADMVAQAAKDMPYEIASKFMTIGDANQVIEQVDQYIKAGARHITIRDVIGQYVYGSLERGEETLKMFSRKVIPYFKGTTKKKKRK
jgi:alkanesulfonate monooxygenase SsuD/methylene tetrahydromethanopterin reductase-like flavin-dependent oxidoreductase (luciferase family)